MSVVVFLSLAAAVVTILGGFAAVAYTDTIQTIIMIVGCTLMLFFGLDKVGGWEELVSKAGDALHVAGPLDDPELSVLGHHSGRGLRGFVLLGHGPGERAARAGRSRPGSGAVGRHVRRTAQADADLHLRSAGRDHVRPLPWLSAEESKSTFVVMLNNLLPSGLRGLVLSALLAALISSILAVMNSVSTMVVRDFVLVLQAGHGRTRASASRDG